MKNILTFRSLVLVFIFPVFASQAANITLKEEATKTIQKSFPISTTGTLTVDNKYGDVDIEVWNKAEVNFVISITVKANSADKAKKGLDEIDVNFTNSTQQVAARTMINGTKSSGWFNWWGDSNKSYKINYKIKCPNTLLAELTNKYGNVALPNWIGKVDLTLSYGNAKLGTISDYLNSTVKYGNLVASTIDKARITIQYSDMKVTSIKDFKLSASYSELEANDVKDLSLTGNYNDYVITNVGRLDITGNYNDLEIGNCGAIRVKSAYTDVMIKQLSGDVSISQSYGSFEATSVSTNSKTIVASLSYTDLTLGSNDYTLAFSGSYSKPALSNSANITTQSKSGSSYSCTAKIGNTNANKITVNTSYGSVIIR